MKHHGVGSIVISVAEGMQPRLSDSLRKAGAAFFAHCFTESAESHLLLALPVSFLLQENLSETRRSLPATAEMAMTQ